MKLKLFCFLLIAAFSGLSRADLSAQAKFVIGNGSAVYVTMSGGSTATPIYLVIGDGAANDAIRCTNQAGPCPASGSASWIISEGDHNFVKWNAGASNLSYRIPFGYSTSHYLPLTFNKTAGNANMAFSTYYPTTTPNENVPLANGVTTMNPSGATDVLNMVVDRWWRIQPENFVSAPTADLTFSYRGIENSIAGISCGADILTAQYWDNATLNWITPVLSPGSTCVTAGIGTASATGVSVFPSGSTRPFILTKNTAPLPVTWLDFSADCERGNMILKWSTASEQNADYFSVERSLDGVTFVSIGTVKAAGNSSAVKNYSFTDTDAPSSAGVVYYRITEFDFNGSSKSTETVIASPCLNDDVIIYGNDGGAVVSVTALADGMYNLEMYNALGQLLAQKAFAVTAGNNVVKIPANVASGVYIVKVYNEQISMAQKIFIRSAE